MLDTKIDALVKNLIPLKKGTRNSTHTIIFTIGTQSV